MKNILFLSFLCAILIPSKIAAQNEIVMHIPANDKIELGYPDIGSYEAHIVNKSMKNLDIKVIDTETKDQISGFGLGKKGKAELMVAENGTLAIYNNNDSKAKVKIKIKEKSFAAKNTARENVSFTLRNNSANSIPLIIPTVMNPNLSPFSNSGVDLKIGQEIIFKNNGKRYVLLTVDDSIADGAVLEVSKLLKDRKRELGLK